MLLSKNAPQPITNLFVKPLVKSDGKSLYQYKSALVGTSLTRVISAERFRRMVREMEGYTCENTACSGSHSVSNERKPMNHV